MATTIDPQPASRAFWARHREVTATVSPMQQMAMLEAAATGDAIEIPDVWEGTGQVDWTQVHGIHAAIVRAGFGSQRADYQFAHNWHGLALRLEQPTGIHRRIAYWYGYPDSAADGAVEAAKFVSVLHAQPSGVRDDDGWVLDAEDSGSFGKLSRTERRSYCDRFIGYMEDKLQRRGWGYSYVPFVTGYLGSDYSFRDCLCWDARYASDMPAGGFPFVAKMRLWQHTDGLAGAGPHRISGIPGTCDVSRIVHTTLTSFLNYGHRKAA
jgi:GH25 family lysozyme M1 (1,4-beta-N-acetylmuramidase)